MNAFFWFFASKEVVGRGRLLPKIFISSKSQKYAGDSKQTGDLGSKLFPKKFHRLRLGLFFLKPILGSRLKRKPYDIKFIKFPFL